MDFATPAHLVPVLAELRAFVDAEFVPLEADLHLGFFALEPRLMALRARARAMGLWLPQLPKAVGGMGLGVLEHGLVSEVLGRSPFGHFVLGCQAPDAGNMEVLLEYGTTAQKDTFLQPLLDGRTRSCFAMTEPEHAGSNPVVLGTTAVLHGDHWILDGHKWFTSGAEGSAFAVVMAVTEPDAAPHERASMVLVPTDTPGFQRVRNVPVMGDRGEGWMSHAELRFTGVRVPEHHLLGGRGHGFRIAQARLGPGRIHHCMRWMGICARAFDEMARRAVTRDLGGGRGRLADQQTIQTWIAEAKAELEATRLLVLRAAWTIDNVGMKAAAEDISLIKFHASDVLMRIIDRAIQVHGAAGITDDVILSWYYRHERGARIYDGPDEVHKAVVARRILGRYASEEA